MKLKALVGLLFFVLFINGFISAQDIVRSDTKVVIEGKSYYVHIVNKGQTIYAICKAYNITESDLAMENPTIFDGLKEGQSLRIPIIKEEAEKKDSDKFYYHTVSQGETIYYLTKRYQVTEKDICKNNPKARDGIKIGQELKIPKPKKDEEAFIEEDENNYYHKVDKKETLYSLSKKYDVSQQLIIDSNPEIEVAGLKVDMLLKIPKVKTISITEVKDTVLTDTLVADTAIVEVITKCNEIDYIANPIKFKVALLLPFMKDGITLSKELDLREINEIRLKPFMEFYEGFLLAVENLQRSGLSLELFVYDTKKDTAGIEEILKKEELKTVDLIIGPVYSELFPMVAQFAKENQIKIISPLSANQDFATDNPYVFQIVPSFNDQLDKAVELLGYSKISNIIILHNDTEAEKELIELYKPKIEASYKKADSTRSISLKTVSFKGGIKNLVPLILKDTSNLVIIPSHDQAFVSDVVTRVFIQFHEKYDVTLIGFPIWTKFDNIALEYLHDMKFHTFMHHYVDYENPKVKQFVSDFRKIYLCEPSTYAFVGYDIPNYFLKTMMRYGTDFSECLDSMNVDLLQAKFEFIKRNENSGFENTGTFMIKYDEEYNIKSISKEDLLYKPEDIIIPNE